MSYIGNQPTQQAFLTDTFSGNASTTAFTMSVAPAGTTSMLVAVTGVVQDPSTYSVVGTTLTFSQAPPTGTNNISVRYLGIPASGVTTTSYRTITNFTATAGQTTFSVPSYTVGYIDVYRNGVRLAAADYTATNGTTVVLTNAATAGDSVVTESFYVSSVLNAIPATAGAVNSTYIANGAVGNTQMAAGAARANFGAGAVLQVVNFINTSTTVSTTSGTLTDTGLTATITPTSATSKILVLVCHWECYVSTSGKALKLQLVKNGSIVGNYQGSTLGYTGSGGSNFFNVNLQYFDSPASTSALTYKTQFASYYGTGETVGVNTDNSYSYITLMEIAA
jgi:hypothetical protein